MSNLGWFCSLSCSYLIFSFGACFISIYLTCIWWLNNCVNTYSARICYAWLGYRDIGIAAASVGGFFGILVCCLLNRRLKAVGQNNLGVQTITTRVNNDENEIELAVRGRVEQTNQVVVNMSDETAVQQTQIEVNPYLAFKD